MSKSAPAEMLLWPAEQYTGVSRYTLLKLCANGEIRGRNVGGRLFLDTRDLDQLRRERSR